MAPPRPRREDGFDTAPAAKTGAPDNWLYAVYALIAAAIAGIFLGMNGWFSKLVEPIVTPQPKDTAKPAGTPEAKVEPVVVKDPDKGEDKEPDEVKNKRRVTTGYFVVDFALEALAEHGVLKVLGYAGSAVATGAGAIVGKKILFGGVATPATTTPAPTPPTPSGTTTTKPAPATKPSGAKMPAAEPVREIHIGADFKEARTPNPSGLRLELPAAGTDKPVTYILDPNADINEFIAKLPAANAKTYGDAAKAAMLKHAESAIGQYAQESTARDATGRTGFSETQKQNALQAVSDAIEAANGTSTKITPEFITAAAERACTNQSLGLKPNTGLNVGDALTGKIATPRPVSAPDPAPARSAPAATPPAPAKPAEGAAAKPGDAAPDVTQLAKDLKPRTTRRGLFTGLSKLFGGHAHDMGEGNPRTLERQPLPPDASTDNASRIPSAREELLDMVNKNDPVSTAETTTRITTPLPADAPTQPATPPAPIEPVANASVVAPKKAGFIFKMPQMPKVQIPSIGSMGTGIKNFAGGVQTFSGQFRTSPLMPLSVLGGVTGANQLFADATGDGLTARDIVPATLTLGLSAEAMQAGQEARAGIQMLRVGAVSAETQAAVTSARALSRGLGLFTMAVMAPVEVAGAVNDFQKGNNASGYTRLGLTGSMPLLAVPVAGPAAFAFFATMEHSGISGMIDETKHLKKFNLLVSEHLNAPGITQAYINEANLYAGLPGDMYFRQFPTAGQYKHGSSAMAVLGIDSNKDPHPDPELLLKATDEQIKHLSIERERKADETFPSHSNIRDPHARWALTADGRAILNVKFTATEGDRERFKKEISAIEVIGEIDDNIAALKAFRLAITGGEKNQVGDQKDSLSYQFRYNAAKELQAQYDKIEPNRAQNVKASIPEYQKKIAILEKAAKEDTELLALESRVAKLREVFEAKITRLNDSPTHQHITSHLAKLQNLQRAKPDDLEIQATTLAQKVEVLAPDARKENLTYLQNEMMTRLDIYEQNIQKAFEGRQLIEHPGFKQQLSGLQSYPAAEAAFRKALPVWNQKPKETTDKNSIEAIRQRIDRISTAQDMVHTQEKLFGELNTNNAQLRPPADWSFIGKSASANQSTSLMGSAPLLRNPTVPTIQASNGTGNGHGLPLKTGNDVHK